VNFLVGVVDGLGHQQIQHPPHQLSSGRTKHAAVLVYVWSAWAICQSDSFFVGSSIQQSHNLQTPPLVCNRLHDNTTYCALPPSPVLRCVQVGWRFFFFCILHNIQLTPQKLSAGRKNHPGAPGAGVWPEDQKRHRGRRETRPPPVSRGSSP